MYCSKRSENSVMKVCALHSVCRLGGGRYKQTIWRTMSLHFIFSETPSKDTEGRRWNVQYSFNEFRIVTAIPPPLLPSRGNDFVK